jgi:hypothetical protein
VKFEIVISKWNDSVLDYRLRIEALSYDELIDKIQESIDKAESKLNEKRTIYEDDDIPF